MMAGLDWSAALCQASIGPAALVLDALFGEPPARFHPVCLMGRLARGAERFWRGCCGPGPTPERARGNRIPGGLPLAGAVAALGAAVPFAAAAAALSAGAAALGRGPAWLVTVVAVYLCLAPRSLAEHAIRVARPLAEAGRVPAASAQRTAALDRARRAVSMLVGRDTDQLDAHGVARACIESVGENMTDGVLATLFWATAGALLAGLPGAACAAVLHRASNVLDALWGKRDQAYARFGAWAARVDDVLNWMPARLSLPAVVLAAWCVPGCSAAEALRMGLRYRRAHASPNSAWSEAAFAGALGLKLGGPVAYRGRPVPYPWMGEGRLEATPEDIARAVRLMWAATLVFACACALAAWPGGVLR